MPILRQIAQLGQPVLRGVAGNVADTSDAALQALIEDMLATMTESDGVGIAAPQVFEPISLFIVAPRPNLRYPDAPRMEAMVMINPEILWLSEEKEKGWEGCLSIPGLRGLVPRHKRIGVRYLSRAGELLEEQYADFPARVFQHEFDHFQGVLFIDRVESMLELVTEKEYLKNLQRLSEQFRDVPPWLVPGLEAPSVSKPYPQPGVNGCLPKKSFPPLSSRS